MDPARAAQLRGNIAVAHKDYVSAEQHFKQAIAASPHPADEWSILAIFYRIASDGPSWMPPFKVA